VTSDRDPVAVLGATGQQGGRVVDALLGAGAPVRALVRDPASSAARALEARGVALVTADQEDGDSLVRGLDGAASLFFLTTFAGADGTEGEVRRGTVVAEAAARAGVPHVLYSSVGGAERHTGIPHFESKRRVEERLAEIAVRATFLRPTFFMENLTGQLTPGPDGKVVVRLPMPGDVPLQMVAVRDIGAAAARLVVDPGAVDGDAIEIAGDELTPAQVAERVGRALGRRTRFEEVPLDVLGDEDLKAMFRWFSRVPAYEADLAATRRLVPDVSDLAAWLAASSGSASGAPEPR
jgi:uncharacterized protein YbjT (DUF2867 family)